MVTVIENRQCYKCSKPLTFYDFFWGSHTRGKNRIFGDKMLFEIWENEIFVLKCCTCYIKRDEK